MAEGMSQRRGNRVAVTKRKSGDATILDVVGNIDLHSSPEIRRVLLQEFETGGARLLLNLSGARYIDSSGVASLIEGLKAARESNGKLILYGLSPTVRQVIELSRLTKFFNVCADETEATRPQPLM